MNELELRVSSRIRNAERRWVAVPAIFIALGMLQAWNDSDRACGAPTGLCAFGTSASAPLLIVLGLLTLASAMTWARLVTRRAGARRVAWDEHGARVLDGAAIPTSIAWADATATIERNQTGQVVSLEVRDEEGQTILVHTDAKAAHSRQPTFVATLDDLARAAERAQRVVELAEERPEVSMERLLAYSMISPVLVMLSRHCVAILPGLGIAVWALRAPLWLWLEGRSVPEREPARDPGGPYRARVTAHASARRDPRVRWAIADVAIGVLALVTLAVLG